jgi:hypothetical protein
MMPVTGPTIIPAINSGKMADEYFVSQKLAGNEDKSHRH